MARTPSQMLELGTQLPAFSLRDTVSDRTVSSTELDGSTAVVAFICNHCPFVVHIQSELSAFGRDCEEKGVKVVAISANDVTSHPEDGPAKMAERAREVGYAFPYLFDETQAVAQAFRAACTPDFYVFDRNGKLAYRGQFDSSRPGNGIAVTGEDLRAAVEAVAAGRAPAGDQKPSIGCNIKWRKGNEPGYS
ncbi:MAG TPA: thioredoxin family protein [Polyangiaceae bacterium]